LNNSCAAYTSSGCTTWLGSEIIDPLVNDYSFTDNVLGIILATYTPFIRSEFNGGIPCCIGDEITNVPFVIAL
jgi:hypothetical protein